MVHIKGKRCRERHGGGRWMRPERDGRRGGEGGRARCRAGCLGGSAN